MPHPRFPHRARLLRALLGTLALGGATADPLSAAPTSTAGVRGNLRAGHWKGARVGLFCYGPDGGRADFDFFDYELDPPAD